MIPTLQFSAVTRQQVKKDALIKTTTGDQVYKVLDDGQSQSKKGSTEEVIFVVEPQNLPPRAMRYSTRMAFVFKNGVDKRFDIVG